jgi:hypothetical protein
MLSTIDPTKEFILGNDVSDIVLGAIQAQKQDWKGRIVESLLGFLSQTLNNVKIWYPIYDRELLAIYDALHIGLTICKRDYKQ